MDGLHLSLELEDEIKSTCSMCFDQMALINHELVYIYLNPKCGGALSRPIVDKSF